MVDTKIDKEYIREGLVSKIESSLGKDASSYSDDASLLESEIGETKGLARHLRMYQRRGVDSLEESVDGIGSKLSSLRASYEGVTGKKSEKLSVLLVEDSLKDNYISDGVIGKYVFENNPVLYEDIKRKEIEQFSPEIIDEITTICSERYDAPGLSSITDAITLDDFGVMMRLESIIEDAGLPSSEFEKWRNYALLPFRQKVDEMDNLEKTCVLKKFYSNMLSDKLVENGYDAKVDIAFDIKSGLDFLANKEYDIVISDLGLPFDDSIKDEEESALLKDKVSEKFPLTPLSEAIGKEATKFLEDRDVYRIFNAYSDDKRCDFGSGSLIVDAAQEKGSCVSIFTNLDHWKLGVGAAAGAGKVSFDQLKSALENQDIINQNYEALNVFEGDSNLYIGEKWGGKFFSEVIADSIKRYLGE